MTLRQAQVDCNKCYHAAQKAMKEKRDPSNDPVIWAYKNLVGTHLAQHDEDSGDTSQDSLAKRLRDACFSCTLTKPSAAEFIDTYGLTGKNELR